MNYLDYSATTPPDKRVLDIFQTINMEIFGNPNSTHELGVFAKQKISETTLKIQKILNCHNYEVIYTSGATEANNLALKGFCYANQHKGKHIISTPYEHSSVTACLNYLAKQGFDVDILEIDDTGLIDLDDLEALIREDTILVSVALINSELGILQDMKRISECLKRHPHVKMHSDMTQAIGKINIDITPCDLVTFSAHKFYGLKGIGALLRKKSVDLVPVIHGGKSTSMFRGGTPPAPLIYSMGVALELIYQDFDKKTKHIDNMYHYLIHTLLPTIENAHLNFANGISHIVNISFPDIEAHVLQKALNKKGIYISTQTACNSESSFSMTVKRITGSDLFAETSVRISISYLTEKEQLDELFKAIKEIINDSH